MSSLLPSVTMSTRKSHTLRAWVACGDKCDDVMYSIRSV